MTTRRVQPLHHLVNTPEVQENASTLANAGVGETASTPVRQHGAYEAELDNIGSLENYVNSRDEEVSYKGNLEGAPVIINFMFTSCAMACPATTFNMRRLQTELTARHHENPHLGFDQVKLLSITVNPTDDRPAVMAEYAKSFYANEAVTVTGQAGQKISVPAANEWLFLTRSDEFLAQHPDLTVDKQDHILFGNFFQNKLGFMGHAESFALYDDQGERIKSTKTMNNSADLGNGLLLKNGATGAQDPANQASNAADKITWLADQLEDHLSAEAQMREQAQPQQPQRTNSGRGR